MEQNTDLAKQVHDCRLCPLATARRGIAVASMPGAAYQQGGIAILTDAVTSEADANSGRPFTGNRAEIRTLESCLEEAGLSRDDVLLMFHVRCLPTRGRGIDNPAAAFNCNTHTVSELDFYAPSVVVLMGKGVLEAVFGKDARITRDRGKPRHTGPKFEWGARAWVPTYHPYAASQHKRQEAAVIKDMTLAKGLMR